MSPLLWLLENQNRTMANCSFHPPNGLLAAFILMFMPLRKKILAQYDELSADRQKQLLAAWLWVLNRILCRKWQRDLRWQPTQQSPDRRDADWRN
jgi:hypothetical protein